MILFYSGSAGYLAGAISAGEPEDLWQEKANIMLSHYLIATESQDQGKRFKRIRKLRKRMKHVTKDKP